MKFNNIVIYNCNPAVAPYTGAWIEIKILLFFRYLKIVAPYTGAWIEIKVRLAAFCWYIVAPYTGAWIEIRRKQMNKQEAMSHPTRVRGLK